LDAYEAVDGFTNGIFCHEKGLLMEDFLQQMKQVQGYQFYRSLYEERKPSVILLMGPSGTGKTAMFTLAMNFLKKPYGIGSGADMTKAGYVGGTPENAIEELFEKADTLEDAENGAILYDEICKLGGSGGANDEFISSQHGLLTVIEGTKTISIEQKMPFGTVEIPFNCRCVLYVLAGAFSELIAHKRGTAGSENDRCADYTTDEHLIAFGLKRELVNRIRSIVSVKPFTEEHIIKIMAFQDSPLKQVLTDFEDNFSCCF
jgi:ATP-dependent protease Clp ATPase subunit